MSKNSHKVQVNFRNVKLTPTSRKACQEVKAPIWGNVSNAIEDGNWWLPVKNYNYTHMKSEFERQVKKFFNLDFDIEIRDFDTDIIFYDNR